jgi:peptidoglycan hydrolase-like protein with peptidoglycan-binding domain
MKKLAFLLSLYSATAVSAGIDYWNTPVGDGDTIAAVQRALRAGGYEPGPADGKLGAETRQALSQAQKDRELEPTGRLDRRTVAALGIDVDGSN